MSKLTKQKVAYINSYNRGAYDRVALMIPKGQKPKLQEIAKKKGVSLNELYAIAMRDYCKKIGVDISETLDTL